MTTKTDILKLEFVNFQPTFQKNGRSKCRNATKIVCSLSFCLLTKTDLYKCSVIM